MEPKTGLPAMEAKNLHAGINKKRATTPSKIKRKNNIALCVKYYLQGMRMADVAETIKEETGNTVSVTFVSTAIKEATAVWQQEQAEFITEHKAIELERINNLEVTYWTAWVRSQEDIITTVTKTIPGKTKRAKPIVVENNVTRRTATGDVRFLNGVESCIAKRLELLGPTVLPDADKPGGNTYNTYIRRVVFKGKSRAKETEAEAEIIKIG